MAMNKFMHPRNIYKNPPDFAKLAKSYEEFSKISKVDVTGKVSIDFKDPHALRVLTKCLLKSDFNLDVIIPEDRLVPTLPLRLNYILWAEDLLNSIERKEDVKGIDIGTGACAIYPLLAAVQNKWHMIGTETDETSLLKAQENVQRNHLGQFIQVKKNPTASVIGHFLIDEKDKAFDFCMCNPPFYSNVQELYESRSPARTQPKNGFTGSPQELITDGGELAFCRKIIKESKEHKDKVLIFTTMVGHKYNLKELIQDLNDEDINHTSTEFCQGRVTRWGLAWTYQDYDLTTLVPLRETQRKKNTPIAHVLPEISGTSYDINSVGKRIQSILQNLHINYKILNKRGINLILDIKALTNTWSNQRRKRRLMKRSDTNDAKKPKLVEKRDDDSTIANLKGADKDVRIDKDSIAQEAESNVQLLNKTEEITQSKLVETPVPHGQNIIYHENGRDDSDSNLINKLASEQCRANNNVHKGILNNGDTATSVTASSGHKNQMEDTSTKERNTSVEIEPVVHAFLRLKKKEKDILLEMDFLDGSAGKEGVHQIVQYIKNNWK